MEGKKKAKKRKPAVKSKDDNRLSPKQKQFCREYIYDWNATRSYLKAYPNTKNANTAGVLAHSLLRNPKIKKQIEEIQQDLEKIAGISRLQVINEHMKIVRGSIAHLHNTWITRKEFEELTIDQKDCISEISTEVRRVFDKDKNLPVEVEYVKIKLYDKQKALDSITKMLGYDAAQKVEHSGEIKTTAEQMTDEELESKMKKLLDKINGK